MDQYYIEEGYVEAAYFERIVDSGTIGFLPYFDENYAETGYVDQHGAEFILVADVGIVVGVTVTITSTTFEGFAALAADVGKIMQLQAAFTGVFTPSMNVNAVKNHFAFLDVVTDFAATASKQTDTGGLLEFIADLNAQSARFRDVDINMDVEFYTSDSSADIGTNIDANATFDAASILTSAFTISVDFDIVQIAQADIVATSIIEANAIEYIKKSDLPSSSTQRPWSTDYISVNNATEEAPAFNSSTKKFGSHSLQVNSDNDTNATQNSYVKYNFRNANFARLPSVNTDDNYQIEFWTRGGKQLVKAQTTSGDIAWRINTNDTDIQFYFKPNQNQSSTMSGTITAGGVFSHVVIRVEGPNKKMWINGALVDNNVINQARSTLSSSNDDWRLIFGDDNTEDLSNLGNGYSYIDEFRILTGTKAQVDADTGYTISSTSITVPTQEFANKSSNAILLHFNNDYSDSLYGIQSTEIDLISYNTLSATLTGQIYATANLNSAFTITADPGTLKEAESDFESVATQLTAAGKVGDFFINADIAFDFAIQDQLFKGFESDLENSITQTTVAVKTVDAVIAISSAFTPEISTDGFRAGAADLETVSSLDVTVTRIQQGVANLQIISTLDIEFTNVKLAEADLQTISSVDSTVTRIQQGASNFEAVATELAIINMIGNTLISATSAFELSASITGTVRSNADLESVFGVETVAVKTVDPTVNIEVISTAIIDTTYFAQTSVNLETAFTVVANAKELILDQYVYRIPRENRTINIYSENRTSTIRTETRTYIVEEN
jgi:hypothetical protein